MKENNCSVAKKLLAIFIIILYFNLYLGLKINNSKANFISKINLRNKKPSNLSGWLRKANFNEFAKLKIISQDDLNKINPFEINKSFNKEHLKQESPPLKEMFYFEFGNGKVLNIYETSGIDKLFYMILNFSDSVLLDNDYPASYKNICFKINYINKSNVESSEIVCTGDQPTRNIWFCEIKKRLNKYCNLNQPLKTIHQQIVIIPTPSPMCNEKWNYSSPWECNCSEGKMQSPINLPIIDKSKLKKDVDQYIHSTIPTIERSLFVFNTIEEKNISIVFEDYKVKIKSDISFGKLVTPELKKYDAYELEFHTPSEHTIGGKKFDMEAQIIFTSKEFLSKKAILSILFEVDAGTNNKFFELNVDYVNLPSVDSPEIKVTANEFSLANMFLFNYHNMQKSYLTTEINNEKPNFLYTPKIATVDFSYFSYIGSLTSPPCDEEVIWFVADKPLPIGFIVQQYFKDSLKEFKSNSRQTFNDSRKVYFYNIEDETKKKSCLNEEISDDNTEKIKQIEDKNESKGHFEKYNSNVTKYLYVDSDEPSGIPGAFTISPSEAGVLEHNSNKIKIAT